MDRIIPSPKPVITLVDEETFEHLQKQHGTIPLGEKPDRTVDVPKKDANGGRVPQFARTVMKSQNIPEAFIPGMEELITEGVFTHEVVTDQNARPQSSGH